MPEDHNSLSATGEHEVIREILTSLPSAADVTIPPGDDCAAVQIEGCDTELLLTSDPVIYGVHFDDSASPEQIGHKAAGRVLSDLAAMGAVPRWVLINIAAPAETPSAHLTSIMKGAQSLCSLFHASIVGGDISASATLSVNAFACGTAPSSSAVSRAGARAGDTIFITGQLGGSRALRHLSFIPRVKEGVWLREHGFATSMIDLSDGVATDLRHILQSSSVGASLDLRCIPVSDDLASLPQAVALSRALCDGEDFELLFTVPFSKSDALRCEWKKAFEIQLTSVGTVTDVAGSISVNSLQGSNTVFNTKGFEHFVKESI